MSKTQLAVRSFPNSGVVLVEVVKDAHTYLYGEDPYTLQNGLIFMIVDGDLITYTKGRFSTRPRQKYRSDRYYDNFENTSLMALENAIYASLSRYRGRVSADAIRIISVIFGRFTEGALDIPTSLFVRQYHEGLYFTHNDNNYAVESSDPLFLEFLNNSTPTSIDPRRLSIYLESITFSGRELPRFNYELRTVNKDFEEHIANYAFMEGTK